MDLVKIGALRQLLSFAVSGVCKSSIYSWVFFLRQAMQERDGAAFEYEIVKTQLLKVQQYNREKQIAILWLKMQILWL